MTVAVMFISLVALIGVGISSANPEYIELESFAVGQCIEASYTAPTTGRTTINLEASDGPIVLHVDYRKHWGRNPVTKQPWVNILILNSRIGGTWGRYQSVEDLLTTPGVGMSWRICAKNNEFSIVLNGKELATYNYRTPVTTLRKVDFRAQGYDSILRKLTVVY